jgi:hypothetical protein
MREPLSRRHFLEASGLGIATALAAPPATDAFGASCPSWYSTEGSVTWPSSGPVHRCSLRAAPLIKRFISQGKLRVVGGYYSLDHGAVSIIAK